MQQCNLTVIEWGPEFGNSIAIGANIHSRWVCMFAGWFKEGVAACLSPKGGRVVISVRSPAASLPSYSVCVAAVENLLWTHLVSFTEQDRVRGIANCTIVKGGGAGETTPPLWYKSLCERRLVKCPRLEWRWHWVFARSPGMADSMCKYILWGGCGLQLWLAAALHEL